MPVGNHGGSSSKMQAVDGEISSTPPGRRSPGNARPSAFRPGIFSQTLSSTAAHFGPMHATAGLHRHTYTQPLSSRFHQTDPCGSFVHRCLHAHPALDGHILSVPTLDLSDNLSDDIKTICHTLSIVNCYFMGSSVYQGSRYVPNRGGDTNPRWTPACSAADRGFRVGGCPCQFHHDSTSIDQRAGNTMKPGPCPKPGATAWYCKDCAESIKSA